MFTTGSKLLIGSAALAAISAVAYGIAQEGALGTIGLVSVAVALSLLAALNVFVRDSNVSATDTESFASSAAAQATARPSLWPLLVGIGATMIALGLATLPAIFILGIVATGAGLIEWLVQGWSERASADRRYNAGARELVADPLELPVAGAILFAVVAYSFSRVMLSMPTKAGTVVLFAAVGIVILGVGVLIAVRRRLSAPVITGVFSVGLIALIAGGAVAGLSGERETHPHETTADLAAANECGPEETEADVKASQNVAAKSNPAATVTFTGGELEIDVPGFDGEYGTLTLQRSTPSNIMFLNDGDEPVRLVADMHPPLDDAGDPVGDELVCTTLVDEGGRQFMTLVFPRPSYALDEGDFYELFVPGTEASVEVIVP